MLCDDGYRKDLSRVYQPRFWLQMRATLQFLFSVLDRLYSVVVICTTFYRHERVCVTWLRSIWPQEGGRVGFWDEVGWPRPCHVTQSFWAFGSVLPPIATLLPVNKSNTSCAQDIAGRGLSLQDSLGKARVRRDYRSSVYTTFSYLRYSQIPFLLVFFFLGTLLFSSPLPRLARCLS
jgi:hypothetical protein